MSCLLCVGALVLVHFRLTALKSGELAQTKPRLYEPCAMCDLSSEPGPETAPAGSNSFTNVVESCFCVSATCAAQASESQMDDLDIPVLLAPKDVQLQTLCSTPASSKAGASAEPLLKRPRVDGGGQKECRTIWAKRCFRIFLLGIACGLLVP